MSTNWPTTKQFDDAAELGSQTALAEIRNGAEEPRESPLSGEFAGEATERSIAEAVGFPVPEEDGDALEELGNAWERCYFDTWQHETEVKAEEDVEDDAPTAEQIADRYTGVSGNFNDGPTRRALIIEVVKAARA